MESHQHNHGKCASQYFTSHPFLFRTLIYHHLFQNEAKLHILNFGWLFNGGKGNTENPHQDDQKVAATANRGGWQIEVSLQYFTDSVLEVRCFKWQVV